MVGSCGALCGLAPLLRFVMGAILLAVFFERSKYITELDILARSKVDAGQKITVKNCIYLYIPA